MSESKKYIIGHQIGVIKVHMFSVRGISLCLCSCLCFRPRRPTRISETGTKKIMTAHQIGVDNFVFLPGCILMKAKPKLFNESFQDFMFHRFILGF